MIRSRIEMVPARKREKVISDIEKVLDGWSTIVRLKPPLVNVQPRRRPFGAESLPKDSAKRAASIFENRGDRSEKWRCEKCGVIGRRRRSCPSF